jgi:S1-C subfamily serine protease
MKKATIALVIFFAFASQAEAKIIDVIRATCRVHSYPTKKKREGSLGTGIVFKETKDEFLILTAGHVVSRRNKIEVEFFTNGRLSHALPAKLVWINYTEDRLTVNDLAVLSVKKELFKKYPLPKPIPLANKDRKLKNGQQIISCGCAEGGWPTAWLGHVFSVKEDSISFFPTPLNGRSGSGVFDIEGKEILGILIWNLDSNDDGIPDAGGTAISIQDIHRQMKSFKHG